MMYFKYPFNGKNLMNVSFAITEGKKEESSSEMINNYSPELKEIENKLLTYVYILKIIIIVIIYLFIFIYLFIN
jgi:hypothetical protein